MSFLCCKCFKKKKPNNEKAQIEINTKDNNDMNNQAVEDSIFSNDSPDNPNKNKKVNKRKSSKKIISNMSEIGKLKEKGSSKIPTTSERAKDDIEVLDHISVKDNEMEDKEKDKEIYSEGNDNRLDSEPNEVYYIQNQDKEFAQFGNHIGHIENNQKTSNKNLFIVENSDPIKQKPISKEPKQAPVKSKGFIKEEKLAVVADNIENIESNPNDAEVMDKTDSKLKKEQHQTDKDNKQNTLIIEYNLSDDESSVNNHAAIDKGKSKDENCKIKNN